MERPATEQPYAGIVWSGKGSVNGNPLDASAVNQKEFLVVPNTLVFLESNGESPLCILTSLSLSLHSPPLSPPSPHSPFPSIPPP